MDDEFHGYGIDDFQDKNGVTDVEDIDEFDGYEGAANGGVMDLDKYRGDATQAGLNPRSVRERIDETLEMLSDLKSRTNMTISRSDLMETLSK